MYPRISRPGLGDGHMEIVVVDTTGGRNYEVYFPTKGSNTIGNILGWFKFRSGKSYHGYNYQDVEIENFGATLSDMGITNGDRIIAY